MFQENMSDLQNLFIMNKAEVNKLISSGHIMVKHTNQVFFVRPREGWEICNDPPGNPKNFWLSEKEIEEMAAFTKMGL